MNDIQVRTNTVPLKQKNNTPKDMCMDKFSPKAGTKSRSGEVDYTKRNYESNKAARIK